MNIEESIFRDRSNDNIKKIASYILDNPNKLKALWFLIKEGSSSMQMRASWVLTKAVEKNVSLLDSYEDALIDLITSTNNLGLKRNLLRSVYHSKLHGKNYSILFDLGCCEFANPNNPVAVRMFSLRVANKIVHIIPELKDELVVLMESNLGSIQTSGLKSAYKDIYNQLKKIKVS